MLKFLKNYWILILAGLAAIGIATIWFTFPSWRRAVCGFAVAAVIAIGLGSAARLIRSVNRD